jgi:hypothetical protein
MFTTTKLKLNKGFTTVELLFYTFGMAIVLSAIFFLIINLYSFYRQISVESKINSEAVIIMRKVVNDLRSGTSIDLGTSNFNQDNGRVVIISNNEIEATSKKYELRENRILYQINSEVETFLTPENISITKFHLSHLESPVSAAIKI